MPTPPAPPERRRSPRTTIQHPCRLLDTRTGRFLIARAEDRSDGGARLRVRTARPFEPGLSIRLLLPPHEHRATPTAPSSILLADAARHAIVRRAVPIESGHQELALEFVTPIDHARATEPTTGPTLHQANRPDA